MTNETNIPRTDPATLTDAYLLAELEREIRASIPPEAPYTGPQPPMTQAAAALQRTRQVVKTSDMLEDLACELETCIHADGLSDPHESAAMLVAQARVLDSVFNRFVAMSFEDHPALPGLPVQPNLGQLNTAFLAQRLCAETVNKMKRHDLRERALQIQQEALNFKKNREIAKRSKEREKWE